MSRTQTTLDRVWRGLRFAGAALYPGEFGAVADWRAILVGGAVQTALSAGIFLADLPYWTFSVAVVAGAALGGGLSRSFEDEYIDGAAATAAGTLMSFGLFLVYVWFLARQLPLIWQANFVWLGSVFGFFAVFAVLPFVCIAGAIAGYWAAVLRRAYLV